MLAPSTTRRLPSASRRCSWGNSFWPADSGASHRAGEQSLGQRSGPLSRVSPPVGECDFSQNLSAKARFHARCDDAKRDSVPLEAKCFQKCFQKYDWTLTMSKSIVFCQLYAPPCADRELLHSFPHDARE